VWGKTFFQMFAFISKLKNRIIHDCGFYFIERIIF
jgi:hypothetical protein